LWNGAAHIAEEDAELGQIRRAAEDRDGAVRFLC
jgi:hypothetical protein